MTNRKTNGWTDNTVSRVSFVTENNVRQNVYCGDFEES